MKERNYGIDLLRLVAMWFVVILHTLGQGGVLGASPVGSSQYLLSWFLEAMAYGAVDIFALISGYVGYTDQEKKYNYGGYFVTWLQVVFYGVLTASVFCFLKPEIMNVKEFFKNVFPVTNGLYWYFSAYTALFFVIPFLNMGIRKCPDEMLKKLFVGFFLIFSVIDRVIGRFGTVKGYSFIWLLLLYIMGAAIKKCDIGKKWKNYQIATGIYICCLAGWAWKVFGMEFQIFDIKVGKGILLGYNSPMVLAMAILYVILFARLRFSAGWKKVIGFAAPGAFAVYILNCQKYIWEYGMLKRFRYLAQENVLTILFHVLGFAALFVIGAVLLDWIRRELFKVCHVKELAEWIAEKVSKATNWCSDKI